MFGWKGGEYFVDGSGAIWIAKAGQWEFSKVYTEPKLSTDIYKILVDVQMYNDKIVFCTQNLNEEEIHLEAHLDCPEDFTLTQFDEVLNRIELVLFEKFGINHTTIQPEFKKEDPKDFIVQD
jgi:divalent metal cation (Fe/Co/Zn/Cd) transporter